MGSVALFRVWFCCYEGVIICRVGGVLGWRVICLWYLVSSLITSFTVVVKYSHWLVTIFEITFIRIFILPVRIVPVFIWSVSVFILAVSIISVFISLVRIITICLFLVLRTCKSLCWEIRWPLTIYPGFSTFSTISSLRVCFISKVISKNSAE